MTLTSAKQGSNVPRRRVIGHTQWHGAVFAGNFLAFASGGGALEAK